ncbi:hypothetical protein JTE90_021157 [Oedothorax gibbosus]|uniref:Uncharacterized protein n=1 Tax=Oedothorax gibbosus TaxID=931172 RepID=A0AAV6U0K5_9ARAC|nr:hypothetical protein JTE90_021157 [Oedothorax gibbosus]
MKSNLMFRCRNLARVSNGTLLVSATWKDAVEESLDSCVNIWRSTYVGMPFKLLFTNLVFQCFDRQELVANYDFGVVIVVYANLLDHRSSIAWGSSTLPQGDHEEDDCQICYGLVQEHEVKSHVSMLEFDEGEEHRDIASHCYYEKNHVEEGLDFCCFCEYEEKQDFVSQITCNPLHGDLLHYLKRDHEEDDYQICDGLLQDHQIKSRVSMLEFDEGEAVADSAETWACSWVEDSMP